MDANGPSDQKPDELFKDSDKRTLALQCLCLWGVTTGILFFVGLAMMTYGFPTMTQGQKIVSFIFWLVSYVFAVRKMGTALREFLPLRTMLSDRDEGSSK